jgi:hypothetical protein
MLEIYFPSGIGAYLKFGTCDLELFIIYVTI